MSSLSAVSRRPFVSLPFLVPSWCELATVTVRRHQSSYRRTKQRLRVKPDVSFGPSGDNNDGIVFNPPSSAPTAYHTPTKFLPASDLRKMLRQDTPDASADQEFTPVLKKPSEKKYHLTPTDIDEIRKLRLEDPMMWSVSKLAKRFDCSQVFIRTVCSAGPQKREIQKQVLEAVKSRWGVKRRMAREDRQLRKEAWARDE
jgi:hypothetical protein